MANGNEYVYFGNKPTTSECGMPEVGVFISYNHRDQVIANAVVQALTALSQDFKVFIDHSGLEGGDEYEPKLTESIRKSQWFVMISSGLGKVEKDMSWCFYEAGQFRAKLEASDQLKTIRDRLCFLYDGEAPSQLKRYQGTLVSTYDRNNNALKVLDETDDSGNYENTALFNFLALLLTKSTDKPIRNIDEQSIRQLMRTGVRRITQAFLINQVAYPVAEDVFQPRVRFTIPAAINPDADGISSTSQIIGDFNVLPVIFGIAGTTTTWAEIKAAASVATSSSPLWINDLEKGAKEVALGRIPVQTEFVCQGTDKKFYRPVFARNVIYSDGKKDCYIAFIPSRDRRFNVSFRSSLLLSSLILTIRFRQRVLPLVAEIEKNIKGTEKKKGELLLKLQTAIVVVEAEASEFGFNPRKGELDEPPLLDGFRDGKEKNLLRDEIARWSEVRSMIFEKIASAQSPNRDVSWSDAADVVVKAFDGTKDANSAFLKTLCEELLYAESAS